MAIIKKLNGHTPKFGKNCFLADNAAIIGDVEMGDDCSIWFGAVLRGDVHSIRIGNKVNIHSRVYDQRQCPDRHGGHRARRCCG